MIFDMRKFVYAIALVALSISSCQDLTIERSNNSTIKIGKVSIVNSSFKTKASSGTNVTTEGEVIVEESIEASETPLTKASEIKTLGDFYLEGYLDSSIVYKVAASDDDKNEQHFIKHALVEKGDNGWTITGAPVWRNLVEHYFWAYAGSDDIDLKPVKANDYTKMSFAYDAQKNDGDLIIAYTSQGGDVDHSDHAAGAKENYIESLVFNHALAEIVVNPSGLKSFVNGHAVENRPLSVTPVFNAIYTYAECEIENYTFTWYNHDSSAPLTIADSNFVIPQEKSSSLDLIIEDTKTGVKFPFVVPISASKGNEWQDGMKYTYTLSSNINVPYYAEDSSIDGFNLNAGGKEPVNRIVGDLQTRYISSINMSWSGLPQGSGSGDYLVLYLATGELTLAQAGTVYSSKQGTVDGKKYQLLAGFLVDNKGKITSNVPDNEATLTIDGSSVQITGLSLPYSESNPTDKYSLYAYYEGGSNGGQDHNNSNVVLTGLKVEISSRRY